MSDPIRWIPVIREIPSRALPDPKAALRAALEASPASAGPFPGPVAVAVGSRAIPGLGPLVSTLVGHLRSRGAEPVIVPAMGTHGGGTAEGQEKTLALRGVTAESAGAPVVSRSDVVRAGRTASGLAVWCDRTAWECRWIVPIHRVKPHTAFRGRLESGPAKLLAVGLGKAQSARALHRFGLARGIPEVLAYWLASGRVPFGVALVQDGRGEISEVRVLEPRTWLDHEDELLSLSRSLLPRLPWDELDLLVVDRIGKDISGTGMDLHVIGLERRFPGCGALPRIRRIVALDLSDGSDGNANGVGYADVVTRRLADRIDWEATYANARATGFLEAASLPYVARDAAHAVAVALESLGLGPDQAAAVRIRDTATLDRFWVSPRLARDLPQGIHKTCG